MIVLIDNNLRENLFPFTYTRHTANIRIGIFTIKEKWELLLNEKVSFDETKDGLHIPSNIIPTKSNYKSIIAAANENLLLIESHEIKIIKYPWQIFQYNDYALRHDIELIEKNKNSYNFNDSNTYINKQDVFVESGAKINNCILNASTGPIFIDANTEIMEGSMIRGPFYLGKNSVVKMGTKIYGATTIGPNCVVGGEIKNSILFGNSNKAHDGYLGDSVIGEWCNIGAGTSNSNVKNTGGDVAYNLPKNEFKINAGNKAGLLMGDYSRAAINTSFNTGTIVGVCCNIFGNEMPKRLVKNFTWGTEKYLFEKVICDINNWKKMKEQSITLDETELLNRLWEESNL